MADTGQEKSCGLKFAEQQLLRHGWEHGKGLGKTENGITEAIKVKLKCDKGGIGHKESEQFTFHWWDHVFNKASSSLQVESDQTGIKLKKTAEEDEDNGRISNKKPRKAMVAKAKLYGCFVKSATLLSGQEQPEPKPSQSDGSSSSDDEEEKLDFSSTTKLPDADLMKACGGRTAHKGARHGLTMSAKLARLEQQEAEFMAKYGKKSQTASVSATAIKTFQSVEQTSERREETPSDPQRQKKKSVGNSNELNGDVSENPETDVKLKKKKKKVIEKVEITDDDMMRVENEVDYSHKTKRKHKKNKKCNIEHNEEERPSPEEMAELHTDAKEKRRKKKKTSKHQSEEEETNDTDSPRSEVVEDCDPKTKAGLSPEETVKQKRKRCKKDKPQVDHSLNDEEPRPKKKKKKKSKE